MQFIVKVTPADEAKLEKARRELDPGASLTTTWFKEVLDYEPVIIIVD